ncbi:hybrid sensor histidine kinase/response regulator [Oscillatoriales cyanobacterium USR001]|nr:hybrid sensor histidine kinase/response regulator [Oscillatoriales cyanobacterium USR001]
MKTQASVSPQQLPRTLSALETYGFGLTGWTGWIGVFAAMNYALGASAIWVWIPGSLVGVLIGYQVKQLGLQRLDVAGGTPNYIADLLKNYPLLAKYAAIGYLISWTSSIPISALVLTDLIQSNLAAFDMSISPAFLKVAFVLLPFIVAFSGTRPLSILNLFLVVTATGSVIIFTLQGLGWLILSPASPGIIPLSWKALSFTDWAKWFLISSYCTYSLETSSSFVADSREPIKTLKFMNIAAWLQAAIFLGASWVAIQLAVNPNLKDDPYLNLIAASQPFWGNAAPIMATFLLTSTALLLEATAVSNCSRILYQLARDRYIAPVFGVVSRRGVFGPALVWLLVISLACLVWGNLTQIIFIGNVGWFSSYTLFHLAIWLRRKRDDVLFPRLSLGIFSIEVVILCVGGMAWGWGDFLLGLIFPLGILALDFVMRRLPLKVFHPSWWQQFYQPKDQHIIRESLMFQVCILIVLLSSSVLIGWGFRALLDTRAVSRGENLILVLLLIVVFVGVAIASWTSLPQIAAFESQIAAFEAIEAREKAESANRAKSEFLANMSHELRTPLNGILGYAQILGRSKVIPEKELQGINIIHQCGSHLLTLINDILDISKIEARKLELVPNAVHLPSLVQGVVEISQIRAQQKGIDFNYEPDAQLPSGIIVDEKRLRQVLINLLGNAIKFTDRGSVTLKVEPVYSNSNRSSFSRLRFSIIDTGIGISHEDIQKLFRAFEQVGEKSRQAEGTGLGLAISQQIVQLMGGQIQVESQLGVGSKFFFEVELPVNDEWVEQQTSGAGHIISYMGEQKIILVVDDRWENRAVIVNLLEPIGFVIIEAENGQQGLDKMRERLPDLVITDLAMPVMDGFAMLEQLRSDRELRALKVLVSSASVSQQDQQMSLAAGGDDFLAKPVNAEDLFKALAKHLQLIWNYEEVVNTAVPLASEIITPAATELEALLELAQQGRLKNLLLMAEQIGQQDERYQPFIQQVLQLANQFQLKKVEQLIKEHLRDL